MQNISNKSTPINCRRTHFSYYTRCGIQGKEKWSRLAHPTFSYFSSTAFPRLQCFAAIRSNLHPTSASLHAKDMEQSSSCCHSKVSSCQGHRARLQMLPFQRRDTTMFGCTYYQMLGLKQQWLLGFTYYQQLKFKTSIFDIPCYNK